MNQFQIKNIFSGEVIFELTTESLKLCVEAAAKKDAYLRGAYLRGAYLRGAYLRGAYLRGADLTGANLTGAYLRGAYLTGAYLRGAYLRGAYLRGADLRGADLTGADLTGADLTGADLTGAKLMDAYGKKIKISKTPLQILGLRWPVFIFDSHIKIGCEFHSISDWRSFDDDRISKMDCGALKFWKENKDCLMAICDANGRR